MLYSGTSAAKREGSAEMRCRELFTVFPRGVSPGLFVYYYRTYSEDGRRTTARSTGRTSVTAAKQYCMKLWKEKAIVPALVQRTTPTLIVDPQGWTGT